jgi:hypothetical protein
LNGQIVVSLDNFPVIFYLIKFLHIPP